MAQPAPDPFLQLWERHLPTLERSALRWCGGDPQLAEEALILAQEKLWINRESYDPSRAPWIIWASRVLHNAAVDCLRSRGKLQPLPPQPLVGPAPADHEQEQLAQDLHDCLAHLKLEWRQLVIGVFLEGQARQDAAAQLGHSPSWATRSMEKALARLRQCLERKGYGEQP